MKGRFVRLKIDPGRHKNIARALDVLDGLTLSAGAVMRAQPFARIGFVAYILLLHMWVFQVINWTSTSPRAEVGKLHPPSGNNLRGSGLGS
jgi:hypothetical protein